MSYYTKITTAGLAAITAAMNNSSKVPITYMAFGDGDGYIPEPDENATSLVNEVYRVGVNKVEVHSKNPNWLVCEAIIPSAVGGFNIREVALYDSTGNTMLAIASYPPTYKPTVEEGAAKIQTIRIVIQIDNSGNFELIVDPDVVLLTQEHLNRAIEPINTNIINLLKLGNEIKLNKVYANEFGVTLNEAVDRLNAIYPTDSNPIQLVVPFGMEISDTVNFQFPCIIDASFLNLANDVDVIFRPIDFWSGWTINDIEVNCNNKSCRVGWDLKKPLIHIDFKKFKFKNIGNENLNTSATSWTAFHIGMKNIKYLKMQDPTTFDAFVSKNNIVGDDIGPCRNILIEDNVLTSDPGANIYIHNPTAVNLKTNEDADAIVVNIGSTSDINVNLNINIYDGQSIDVGKRHLKIIGRAGKFTKGINFSGHTSVINKSTILGYSGIDISGDVHVIWNGSIYGTGYIIGMNIQNGAVLGGDLKAHFDMPEYSMIEGNNIRALNQTGTPTIVNIGKLSGYGGAELNRLDQNHYLSCELEHTSFNRAFSLGGSFDIPKATVNFIDASSEILRSDYLISVSGADNVKRNIKKVEVNSKVTNPIKYAISCVTALNLKLDECDINGTYSTSPIYLRQPQNIRLSKVRSNSSNYLARIENGGSNLVFKECFHPVSLKGIISGEVTNLVELETQNF